MKRARYYVFTREQAEIPEGFHDAERWTPQRGVKAGPYSLFGLRKPLRKLRRMGYEAASVDPCVRVEKVGWEKEEAREFAEWIKDDGSLFSEPAHA